MLYSYLKVPEVGRRGIEEADSRELNSGIQAHVFEATEARDKSRTSFALQYVSIYLIRDEMIHTG